MTLSDLCFKYELGFRNLNQNTTKKMSQIIIYGLRATRLSNTSSVGKSIQKPQTQQVQNGNLRSRLDRGNRDGNWYGLNLPSKFSQCASLISLELIPNN